MLYRHANEVLFGAGTKMVKNGCLRLVGCMVLLLLCPPTVAEDSLDEGATQAERDTMTKAERQATQHQIELELRRQISQIELPDNPTRAQCEEYADSLRKFIGGPYSDDIKKRAIEKISLIPAVHVAVLTQVVFQNYPKNPHVRQAFTKCDPESYRKIVVNGLREEPIYIYLVAYNGWYQDVKVDILAKLKKTDPRWEDLTPIWFQAFVEVAEPKHYELLHQLTLNNEGFVDKLALLGTLNDYDLARTVNACWGNLKQKRITDGRIVRSLAIGLGNVDALADAINEIANPRYGYRSTAGELSIKNIISADALVRRHLDFRATNKEIAAWFKANRDELVFDNFRKRFKLPEPF